MPRPTKAPKIRPAQVVACMQAPADLRAASRLRPGMVDLLEFRADAMPGPTAAKRKVLEGLKTPVILTVRHPGEGGANNLDGASRHAEFNFYWHLSAFVDLELLHGDDVADLRRRARDEGRPIILSFHDFGATPDLRRLRRMAGRAKRAGAAIFKVATRTDTLGDLFRLVRFLSAGRDLPLSAMGMGRFGRVSRLLLAQAGSALNYGYLSRPAAPGQWPAIEFKQLLREGGQAAG